MDQELWEYLDKHFRESAEQLQQFRQEATERLDRVESGVRENRVLIEGLQGQIQLVTEEWLPAMRVGSGSRKR